MRWLGTFGMHMPKYRLRKIVFWSYMAGYLAFNLITGYKAWSIMDLPQWQSYMSLQMIYAVFWPIVLILRLVGISLP